LIKSLDWENSEMNGHNKEPPHNTLIPYQDTDSDLIGRFESSRYYKSLNGNWKFNWVRKSSKRPTDYYKNGYDVSNWEMGDFNSLIKYQFLSEGFRE